MRFRGLLPLLALVLPAAASAAEPEPVAPPAPAGGAPEPAPLAPPAAAGPRLELEGSDLPAAAGPRLELEGSDLPPAEPGQQPGSAEKRSMERRLDPGTTLSERAGAILDRTVLGGYGEHDFVVPRDGASTFRNHRYVLFVHSQITERISTATEIEFEFAGSPLKRDGVLGEGEVLLEFSVLDLKLADWLVFRAGVILVPTSNLNLRHDAPAQELPDRPIAYTTVNPSTWFESGAGFLGTFELGGQARLSYEAYVLNGLDAKIEDGMGLRGARGSHLQDNNDDKALTARLAFSPMLGLEVAAAGYSGSYDLEGRRLELVNGSAFWRIGAFDLHGELVRVFLDPGYVQGFTAGSPANTRAAIPTGMSGFYAQLDHRLHVDALFDALPDEWRDGHLGLTLRYEEMDTDDEVLSEGDRARATLGVNFRPVPAYVLKQAFSLEKSGSGAGEQPHAWVGSFWDEPGWQYVASVAFLF